VCDDAEEGSTPVMHLPDSLGRPLRFALRVVRSFLANRGVLLAGGVGYNVLLSLIPLFIVSGAVLSLFVDEGRLTATLRAQLVLLAPGQAEAVIGAILPFLRTPELFGVVGFAVLLFFSSLAFRMFEDAIAIIFGAHRAPRRRSIWFSTLVPYAFVALLMLGLLATTVFVALVDGVGDEHVLAEDGTLSEALTPAARALAYLMGFMGLGLTFTALFKVLPVVTIAYRHAVVGGFLSAALWEGVLRLLVWYFERLSLVDTVYGPFASVIVLLLGLEIGAGIVLLGAQVIAELERSRAAGVPWWQEPDAGALR
jgi:YihY family inner membrane protein